MTLSEAIQKAIDANPEAKYLENLQDASVLLQPIFWQSLGKSLEWDSADYGICSITREKCELNPVFLADCLCHREGTVSWRSELHRFIDHLADGKPVEDFFKELK